VIIIESDEDTIILKAGTGGTPTEEPDPCKSVTLTMDPMDRTQLIVTWVPGDNNDSVHYEYSVDTAPVQVGKGDRSRTVTVGTTTWDESIFRYYSWHYVCIWGMKGGKYSKNYLMASIVTIPDGIIYKMMAYITRPANDGLPQDAGTISIDLDRSGAEEIGEGSYQFSWDGEGGTVLLSGSATANISTWVDDQVRATQMLGVNSGKVLLTGMNSSLNSILNIGENLLMLECVNTIPVLIAWGVLSSGHYPWVIYDERQPILILAGAAEHPATSWWLSGGSTGTPPEPLGSSVSVCGPLNGGLAYADTTIYFNNGGPSDATSYIAFSLIDPDNDTFHVWASVPAGGRPTQLYVGTIQICANVGNAKILTYNGYLPLGRV
jgi:hypothetical protein